ncbi:XAC0095 family protein [Lysobacter terrae]
MEKEPRPTAIVRKAYQLPEEEYRALTRARDHLRLLARLTEPRNLADVEELPLSPLALTHCFQRLADDLDDIVRVAWWPGDADG